MNLRQFFIVISLLFLSLHTVLGVEPFRFALLTDIHISDKNSIEDLNNSVNQINDTKNIDFVLVTGDITETGDRKSLEIAKSILDRLTVKYYAIPGNHETKWSPSGCTDFGRVFGSERFRFEHKGVSFLGFNTGPIMRMADGHVASQDIEWLKSLTRSIPKDEPMIIATHYPLQYGDVDNWYEVTDVVRSNNVRLFVGGHYHRNAIFSYDGIPGLINRSNLRAKEPVGGYTLYDISPDSIKVFEQTIGGEPKMWAALSMTEKYFEEQGSSTKYPDMSVNKAYANVNEKWLIKNGASIYSSPVVWRGRVYVADDLGMLHCISLKTGKHLWKFASANRILSTPAVADGVVVFGSSDMSIYGVNALSGKMIWQTTTSAPVLGAVSIESGVAYIGGSDSCFRAIDIQSGKTKWTFCGLKNYVETKPLILANQVIFGAWDNYLYALDKNSGIENWRWRNGKTSSHYSPAAVWPVANNDKVFVVDPERAMTAIDLHSGKEVWRTMASQVRESIGMSNDGTRVYAKTMQDSVVCYSALGNIPKHVWAANVAYGYEHNPSMLIEKDNIVFGSTKNGLIFALKASNGELLWKYKIGNSLVNTVLPLDGKQLLFTSVGGEIGLLKFK